MTTLEVHDPDYTAVMNIPITCVYHVPPRHLAISRLVLCRNFDPKNPLVSCAMGDKCKFVHANVDGNVVQSHHIHVNYAWRTAEAVTYDRLPAGELLEVLAPNNRHPVEYIPSHLVLATRGAKEAGTRTEPLSHCAHYYFNRMCNRGDACNFVHAVYVDTNAKDFQRAPPRAGAGRVGMPRPPAAGEASKDDVTEDAASQPQSPKSPAEPTCCRTNSCTCSGDEGVSDASSERALTMTPSSHRPARHAAYRRNPYSLVEVTVAA